MHLLCNCATSALMYYKIKPRSQHLGNGEEGSLETHSVEVKSYHHSRRVFGTHQWERVKWINTRHLWMLNWKGWWQLPRHTVFTVFKILMQIRTVSEFVESATPLSLLWPTQQDSPTEDNAQPRLPALNLTIIIIIGLWFIVKYEGEEFLGEVTCIEDSDVELNMHA